VGLALPLAGVSRLLRPANYSGQSRPGTLPRGPKEKLHGIYLDCWPRDVIEVNLKVAALVQAKDCACECSASRTRKPGLNTAELKRSDINRLAMAANSSAFTARHVVTPAPAFGSSVTRFAQPTPAAAEPPALDDATKRAPPAPAQSGKRSASPSTRIAQVRTYRLALAPCRLPQALARSLDQKSHVATMVAR
jgi:hypothetical protein